MTIDDLIADELSDFDDEKTAAEPIAVEPDDEGPRLSSSSEVEAEVDAEGEAEKPAFRQPAPGVH